MGALDRPIRDNMKQVFMCIVLALAVGALATTEQTNFQEDLHSIMHVEGTEGVFDRNKSDEIFDGLFATEESEDASLVKLSKKKHQAPGGEGVPINVGNHKPMAEKKFFSKQRNNLRKNRRNTRKHRRKAPRPAGVPRSGPVCCV